MGSIFALFSASIIFFVKGNKMNKLLSALYALILLSISGSGWAAIVSVSGAISEISAPTSVTPGSLESSNTIWAFDEQQNYQLSSDLFVDELSGTSTAGSIAAGTTVNSYFLHADPDGTSVDPADAVNLSGTILFDKKILGIVWSGTPCAHCPSTNMYLDASDYLGATGTVYPTGDLGRGYEVEDFYVANGTQDFVTISADGYSLTMVSSAALPLYSDQLRVITSVVPLPLPVWLFGSGLVALLGFARKNR